MQYIGYYKPEVLFRYMFLTSLYVCHLYSHTLLTVLEATVTSETQNWDHRAWFISLAVILFIRSFS